MSQVKAQVRETKLTPEQEARRRVALAQIRQYSDPALRLRARDVEEFDPALARLAERMITLMRDANGVGLAANQVGVLRRLFVFQQDGDEATAVVNPQLLEGSDERETSDEGCLSLQGVSVPVERHAAVTLEGSHLDGSQLRLELREHAARVVQHELDHLDGVLILDRTDEESRREALAVLRPRPVLSIR